MVEFKVNVSTKDGKTHPKEVKDQHANALLGKKIGDEVDGIFVGLPGYRLVITGGSDKDGFSMRSDMNSVGRKKILLTKGTGLKSAKKGKREKKYVRGKIIGQELMQINMKVIKEGPRKIETETEIEQGGADESSQTA
jgi:SSU ribosomal protein S6E